MGNAVETCKQMPASIISKFQLVRLSHNPSTRVTTSPAPELSKKAGPVTNDRYVQTSKGASLPCKNMLLLSVSCHAVICACSCPRVALHTQQKVHDHEQTVHYTRTPVASYHPILVGCMYSLGLRYLIWAR